MTLPDGWEVRIDGPEHIVAARETNGIRYVAQVGRQHAHVMCSGLATEALAVMTELIEEADRRGWWVDEDETEG